MLPVDENTGNRPLPRHESELLLNGTAVGFLVEFVNDRGDAEIAEERLCLCAVGTIRFGPVVWMLAARKKMVSLFSPKVALDDPPFQR